MFEDLTFAVRRLRQSPRFTIAILLTLALTVGVNAAIFSVADAVLFRPLPYDRPDEVFVLRAANVRTGQRFTSVPYKHLDLIADHVGGVAGVGTLENGPRLTARTAVGTRGVPTAAVSANYFELLGVRAARGRVFTGADVSATGRPALLAYATWRQSFGGDTEIIGRSIAFDTTTYDVIGVLPEGFVFPSLIAGKPALVTLLPARAAGTSGGTFNPIVRLARGVSRGPLQAEIDAVIARPGAGNPPGSATVALDDVRSVLYPTGRPIMALLVVAAALVLAIGCMNLAIMLAARGRRQEHETAIRAALGASRARLVRPVIFEAGLLGLAGAALALLATSMSFNALVRQVPRMAIGSAPVGVDVRVSLFALALGVIGGLLAIAIPAWRTAATDVQRLLQNAPRDGDARRGFGAPVLVAQVALAVVLVFGAVIVARAFVGVLRVPLGFTPDTVIIAGVWPPADTADPQAFYLRAIEAIARRQDVASVGAAGSLPLNGAAPDEGAVSIDDPTRTTGIVHVLPGYFEAADIRLVRGRLLNEQDVANGGGAAVVAESAARLLFPDRDPLGAAFGNGRGRTFTVVGVVADVLKSHDRPAPPPAYVIPNRATRSMNIVVRARARRDATLAGVRQEIAAIAPGVPVTAEWWSDTIASVTAYRNPRFQTMVLGAFAALALGLTALGMFAVTAFTVASRTREMGIRLAIGASPRSLIALTARGVVVPVGIGIVLGLLATRWFSDLARAQLFRVETHDPVTLGAAVLIVTVSALVAAYIPARHASRVDPLVVLREP